MQRCPSDLGLFVHRYALAREGAFEKPNSGKAPRPIHGSRRIYPSVQIPRVSNPGGAMSTSNHGTQSMP